jgi:hypothetical protein
MDPEQSFRKAGECWVISYEGQTIHLRDASGLRYLACLLRHPGERLHAIEVIGAEEVPRKRGQDAATRSERARIRVRRAVAAALEKITANHAALGAHFARTIRTGTFSSYSPDPRLPIRWEP